ncbi:hypothetical protein FPRO06_07315 [Fusarium proliferatum]|nr:hypothetical protein FPRO06_07315 [Fusarium proliferatum]
MASEESPPPKTMLVFSNKSPEEAAIFGLRGSDIQNLRAEPVPGPPARPDEWGFTSPTADGVCKYCQLMLHPDPPQLIQHQPNIMHLINSGDTCSTCKWLEVSLQRGATSVLAEFQRGNPELCDENNFSRPVTVELTKHEKYIMAVGWVGDRQLYTNGGIPLTISSPSRLGSLASRRFWIPHDELDESEPFKRQDTLKMWLNECENHEQCIKSLPNTKEAKLPTRVLDLSGSVDIPSDPKDIKIKLRETGEGETGTYTALSYCWGTNPDLHFKTTSENLEKHKEGIDFFDLPLTQRETILATLYLGIRYLWIDGLCIIQDSREDWEAESVKMGSVYTNAHLTLAATSSDTPEMGLLLPFQGAECVKIHGETVSVRMETHRELDRMSEPLNTRGWTLQEGVLASRIVCFGKEQWLWKCPSRYATEDGLIDVPRDFDGGLIQWADIVQQGPGEDGKNYLRHWYRMVTNYSSRDLTYQSDKWNAIAGLTEMFRNLTGYTYLVGLWEEDLANGLVWEAKMRGVIRESGSIPSWSWMSVKGGIKGYVHTTPMTSMIELLQSDLQWEGTPLASPLKVARLTVKGKIIQATLGARSVTQDSRHHVLAASGSDEIFGEAFLDSKIPDGAEMPTVSCLFVMEVPEKEYFTLLLTPASDGEEDGHDKGMTRLGIGVFWTRSRFYSNRTEGDMILDKASEATVVLV